MGKLKVGIIGAGGIAQSRHLPALDKLSEKVAIQAVHDLNGKKAQLVAAQYNIPHVTGDYRDMLTDVDAVFICTPNKFHSEIAVAALNQGVHVFCEKPMAISEAACQEMLQAAKASGKILSIGYHYRFMKESQAAKRVIEAGDIGKPLVARVQALRRRKVPGWGVFTNKALQGGGCLIDFGCHSIDLAMWLLGNPKPVHIIGKTYNELSKTPNQVNIWGKIDHTAFDVEDHATGYVLFDNGCSLLLEASWAANIEEDIESISLSGVDGGVNVFPFQVNQSKHGMLLNSEANWLPGNSDPGLRQAENFVNSCLGLEEPVVKPEEAIQVSQIIEMIYKSSEQGKSLLINN
ncbi:Gfo/Idh/MocA family protein [Scopulibacillus cellulosilyticus]|uniref:Gfo/Idh/MocA family protein n=1 Tax=Scopulibacillus cellulosilyticus TaxID=2665665 RepID=A0ABW2PW97_9BACL